MEGTGGCRETLIFGIGVDDGIDNVGRGTLRSSRFREEGDDSLPPYNCQIYLQVVMAKVQPTSLPLNVFRGRIT